MRQFSQSALALTPPTAQPGAALGGRLLIVDDLADNRTVLTRRFQRRGFEIVEAESGEEALRLVDQQEFDCVLLDVMMPGMDGTEVLRELRRRYSQAMLPVIMVTAKNQSEDVVDSLKNGANDYVTKPVDFSVALARVNSQIERRRSELALLDTNSSLNHAKSNLERRLVEGSARLMKANAAIQDEITRRTASEDRIAYLAHHDTLTGLANRFTFDLKLQELRDLAREEGAQISLLFIDLDGFKNVNDTLGHTVGDDLLKEVAARITTVIGGKDFCARLGGDEFAIVHTSDNAEASAGALAKIIIDDISGGYMVGGNQVYVGASVGIAVLTGGDSDPSVLLRQADLAMYRAKAEGRGVHRFFEPEMGRLAEHRRSLELDLRMAVANGDFELYYQPVVDLKSRRVSGVEALMRWNHAARGFVPPIEFITLAEETGLIVAMGEWALKRACADAARWPASMRLAINLSPVQFRTAGLVEAVEAALKGSGLKAERLELEITESVILGNNPQNLQILRRLRELGVRISLDDFGTGYSGLGYFRNFLFDKVKIDKSFVHEMHERPDSMAIVRAAIGLGRSLGICTTAEGVENQDQFERLLQEGCNEVQGFLLGVPQPSGLMIEAVDRIGLKLR